MADAIAHWNASPVPDNSVTTAGQALLRTLQHDRVLRGVFALCGLLIAYQLTVTLLQPPWTKPVTDWLRTALAWPQFLVVAWVAVHLLRRHRSGAVAWGFAALGLLSYAVARTMWTVSDIYIFPQGVPFPSAPDLFFILQYPVYFMALFMARPLTRLFGGLQTLVDGLLWMGAISVLSWYFLLDHIAGEPGESPLAKLISMGYQIGDLMAFYGIVMYLAHPKHTHRDQVIAVILCLAFACLFIADTWAAVLLFSLPHTIAPVAPRTSFGSPFTCWSPWPAWYGCVFAQHRRPPAPRQRLSA
jgi:hypothetical protein